MTDNDHSNFNGAFAVSGATGLVGGAVVEEVERLGGSAFRLVRRKPTQPNLELEWNATDGLKSDLPENVDTIVHLAGENIAEGRWSDAKKQRIRASRVDGTTALCRSLATAERKPKTLICASAIGFYGSRGDDVMTEQSEPGDDYLAGVCQEWEQATASARDAGIRVVNLRIGVIMSRHGGALAKMLLPFKLGLGGRIGDGRQWWSWIAIDDVVGAILHAAQHEDLSGPVNVVAPNPLTNSDFTRAVGRAVRRPTIFPMPAFAARLAFGEMGDALMLSSTRVQPEQLISSGYAFKFAELDDCLRHVLGIS